MRLSSILFPKAFFYQHHELHWLGPNTEKRIVTTNNEELSNLAGT